MKPRLTIIGLGRLGTSIGLALKKTGAELEIIGHDKSREAAAAAQKAGAVDRFDWNLFNACEGAGLIVLSMPLAGVLETLDLIKDDVPPGVIVTDTASVKTPVLEAARRLKPGAHFIGGDPVFRPDPHGKLAEAGADLFQNAVYCLTPTPETDPDAMQVLTGYVSMLGARPLFLDAAEHDGLAAGGEHLATLTAVALLRTTTASPGWRELNKFAGEDYFKETELATREPGAVASELFTQREPLGVWIDQTVGTLRDLRRMLANGDEAGLKQWLEQMQDARDRWLADRVATTPDLVDMSEVRSNALRIFVGGLATRRPRDKKK